MRKNICLFLLVVLLSLGVCVNAWATPFAYITNGGSNDVTVIDTATNTVIGAPIPVGAGPHAFGQFIGGQQVVSVWTGAVSFPLKLTTPVEDASGNTKFKTFTETFGGTLKMFISDQGPQPNENGCYVLLESNDAAASMCFKEMAAISTEVSKSRTDQFLLVGTGDFSTTMDGTLFKGNCYLDSKGTLKKDKSGEVISISLTGKIGGGSESNFVFSGNVKATLTK